MPCLANSREERQARFEFQSLARLSKAFHEVEGVSIELGPVLSRASADEKDLPRSRLDEAKRNSGLKQSTREPLEIDVNYANAYEIQVSASKMGRTGACARIHPPFLSRGEALTCSPGDRRGLHKLQPEGWRFEQNQRMLRASYP
uniref:Uncharacterized protein n=1 Tax=Candidatus Kentrum sp. TC TaxID=2126339 RepID=A0A450YCX1_9GAMM|nr:MAG: hypothetical protein BECKTC1821D_GA0114238_100622 [Candidatus Kentron sp. TC]